MKTIGSSLESNAGVGPGFDTIRVLLAVGVVTWHCWPVTNGSTGPPSQGPWWAIVYSIVPMFFALSGFLVTGSAMRLPLGRFAVNRVLRIVPALVVDTAVSILIFGLAFTTLAPIAFLTNPTTLSYWLNCVGEIHYLLPGVFTRNPLPTVNNSLWTIPGELCCYLAMGLLLATRTIGRWQAALAGILFFFAIDLCNRALSFHFPLEKQLAGESGKLVGMFLAGSIAYTQRYRIPLSPVLAAFAAGYIALFAIFGSVAFWTSDLFIGGATIALTYLVVWLGMQRLPLPWPLKTGDYSYGVYLYGFPIQQAVVHLTGTRSPFAVLALALPTVFMLAALSWHFVEKPTLKLRRFLPKRTLPSRESNSDSAI